MGLKEGKPLQIFQIKNHPMARHYDAEKLGTATSKMDGFPKVEVH